MKRPRFSARERLSREAVELGKLAAGLAESGSKLEDSHWETRLARLIDELLESGAEDDLVNALERLFDADPRAHDELADMIEARAESCRIEVEGKLVDALLFAVPMLTTSKYSIPSGPISRSVVQTLSTQLAAHQFAKDSRIAVADYLFSPDQLPRTFTDTWRFMRELAAAAIAGSVVSIDSKGMAETNRFLSDVRYLVGAVVVNAGAPIFRWNESDATRDSALDAWLKQGAPNIEPLLTGATFQLLRADAYHSACRAADREARPYSVQASIRFLQDVTGHKPEQLRAVIGPFHDRQLEEYRIGLGPLTSDDIWHGVVWPLLGAEDDTTEVPGQIEETLKAAGVNEVVILDHRFPFEFCDDCGAPLYPNVEGEVVHAEMPEQAEEAPRVLH